MKIRKKFSGFQVEVTPNGGELYRKEKATLPLAAIHLPNGENMTDTINGIERDTELEIINTGTLKFNLGEFEIETEISAEEILAKPKAALEFYNLFNQKIKDSFSALTDVKNHNKIAMALGNIMEIIGTVAKGEAPPVREEHVEEVPVPDSDGGQHLKVNFKE